MALVAAVAAAMTVGVAARWGGVAHAYEFEVRARTIGQGYSLRSFRLTQPSPRLDRRRFTQVLSLGIFDIGELRGPRRGRALYERAFPDGLQVSFVSYLRLSHDDGPWAQGRVLAGGQLWDAVDLTPELESDLLHLEVLYAYAQIEGLGGGWFDAAIGRQLRASALDWWSLDGATLALNVPPQRGVEVSVEGFGGLRVRESSPVASATTELDGTGGADCAEYVEGAAPGSGAWRPIDRIAPGRTSAGQNRGFENDYDICPQREQAMPTFGGAIAGAWERPGRAGVWGRLEYRRATSRRPGLIGPADRFDNPDRGYYPNESGTLGRWGINEEVLSASLRAQVDIAGGRGQIGPYVAGRYDRLIGAVGEAHAGLRLRYDAHAIEPEVYYSAPSFDGDSIFLVFGGAPFTDLRATYHWRPAELPVSTYVRTWARRYHGFADNPSESAGGGTVSADWARGVHLGVGYGRSRRWRARLDAFHEDGYGGRRSGGYGTFLWQLTAATGVRARVAVVDVDEAEVGGRAPAWFVLRDTTAALQGGASYRIDAGVTLHLMAEQNLSRFDREQVRVLAVVDLAFLPEVP